MQIAKPSKLAACIHLKTKTRITVSLSAMLVCNWHKSYPRIMSLVYMYSVFENTDDLLSSLQQINTRN